jgi:hypothetical protein
MTQYTQHPLSAAFPAMSDAEYLALKDSITDLGVQNAITIFEGQVLDGWNRYRAATELGMECPERELEHWIDPVEFVRAQNKHRRHVSIGAWALVEAALHDWKAGAGRPRNPAPGAVFSTAPEVAAAEGIGLRTMERAKAVNAHAIPEVKRAALSEQVSLKAAEQIARLPADLQEQALAEATAPKPRPTPAPRAPSPAPKPVNPPPPPPGEVEEPQEPPPPEYTALEAAQDTISDLQAALAIASMGDAPEADRLRAQELIAELQAEVKSLAAQLRAANVTRDALLHENAEVKKQLAAQRREIDRLKKQAGQDT